jgi:hypothetical protein
VREKVEFTKYAELQIQERGIRHEDILNTLNSPGQVLSGKKGRKIAQKKVNRGGEKGLLRIIFEEKVNAKVVITVYWTSKIEKYWR